MEVVGVWVELHPAYPQWPWSQRNYPAQGSHVTLPKPRRASAMPRSLPKSLRVWESAWPALTAFPSVPQPCIHIHTHTCITVPDKDPLGFCLADDKTTVIAYVSVWYVWVYFYFKRVRSNKKSKKKNQANWNKYKRFTDKIRTMQPPCNFWKRVPRMSQIL